MSYFPPLNNEGGRRVVGEVMGGSPILGRGAARGRQGEEEGKRGERGQGRATLLLVCWGDNSNLSNIILPILLIRYYP